MPKIDLHVDVTEGGTYYRSMMGNSNVGSACKKEALLLCLRALKQLVHISISSDAGYDVYSVV